MTTEQRYHRWEELLRWPMTGLAVLFLLLLLLPLQSGVPTAVLAWTSWLETAIWIIFILEYLLLLGFAPDKSDYLSTHVVETVALVLPAFRAFRIFRLLRFTRFMRVGRTPLLVLATVRNLRRARVLFDRFRLGYVLLVTLALLTGGAGVLFLSEGANEPFFATYARCLWWCVFAVISTSYDQGLPQTVGGNIVGLIMMVLGIALAGIFTAAVASVFVRIERRDERRARPRRA